MDWDDLAKSTRKGGAHNVEEAHGIHRDVYH